MIHIPYYVQTQLIKDALRTYPFECCGFVFGQEVNEIRYLHTIQVVENAKEGDQTRRFEISSSDYLKAEKYALDHDLLLLGVYHSHPNHPSIPSEHDRKVAQPYFSYLILSVEKDEFKSLQSWRLNDQFQFEEEPIYQTIQSIKAA
ncbi:MAG: M67 family metallopeptidase [Bacteroidia bacterium]|nr:M67 family metallopeptidase [Bacteroidia bacterium]